MRWKKIEISPFPIHNAFGYQYIINEFELIRDSICNILDQHNGKKIAFVSDHGITYLSQLEDGLKIGGINSDHEGRLATYSSHISNDDKYIKLEDGKIICSLTHKSLVDKVRKGHGAHGGCTPEEILVPIIIVSSQKNASLYSIKIVNDEIDANTAKIEFNIKGLSSIDIPSITYNDVTYQLYNKGADVYESEHLNLVETETKVHVYINDEKHSTFNIKFSTGATEEDLFDF